jgi:hypothetical protein
MEAAQRGGFPPRRLVQLAVDDRRNLKTPDGQWPSLIACPVARLRI